MHNEIRDLELETLTQGDLFLKIDRARLLKQFDHVLASSSFYQKKLKGYRDAASLLRDLDILPFTEKKELIDDQLQYPPFGSNLSVNNSCVRRVHRTSGTTGRPVFLALTAKDIAATIDSGSRCFWASGLRPEDIVFHCLNYCMWMGGFTDHQSLEATGATVVPYGVGNSSKLIEAILNIRPTAIHCTVSYMAKLELLLETEFKMDPRELGLRKGLFAGEAGIQNPMTRSRIEKVWGFKAMDANYGISDVLSMFGAECGCQQGMHFMGQGNIHVELIDPDNCRKLPFEKGVKGELVVTNINKEAQPLVRLRSHDVIDVVDHNKCACGRSSFRFKVLGRSDDMIVVKGVNIFPGAIGAVVSGFIDEVTGEYQVVAKGLDMVEKITVRVECGDGVPVPRQEEIGAAIKQEIRDKMDVNADIVMVLKGEIPRTGEKTKRLVRE